jgi:putative oxidoreductase
MTKSHDFVALLARILLGLIFLRFGGGKVMDPQQTIEVFRGLGLPAPTLAYGVTILVEIVVGICFIFGFWTRLCAVILAGWCIATGVAGHSDFSDRNTLIHFYKNMSMCGGFLYASLCGPGGVSVDRWLFLRKRRRA